MGWAIPASIGAAKASFGRQVVCLTGDGGAMMNIQELHTIAQQKLPVSIFVFANNGYATMRIPQMNHFGRESISGPNSGNPTADLYEVAISFGLDAHYIKARTEKFVWKNDWVEDTQLVLSNKAFGVICLAENQVIAPRVQAALGDDGKFKPATLEDMWPPVLEDAVN